MRRRLFVTWAAIRWIPLMFLVAQGLEAPLVAHPSHPIQPIKVWSAKASWYGPRFQGRATASGETFDMFSATAASRDLPIGALVRLYNPKTHPASSSGSMTAAPMWMVGTWTFLILWLAVWALRMKVFPAFGSNSSKFRNVDNGSSPPEADPRAGLPFC
jgi:hypothetical protein